MKQIALCILVMLFLSSCHTSNHVKTNKQQMSTIPLVEKEERLTGGQVSVSSPKVYVYKTKNDYSQLVPVIMDASRSRILSYPHPQDLIIDGKLCTPTLLQDGYWLDNRGISQHVVFLSYTYDEYSKLPAPPSMDELLAHVIDKYPVSEWHDCGRRADYKNIVSELNKLIEQGFLRK